MELEVEAYIRRRYEGEISDIEIIEKEDLDLVCHLLCMLNLIFCLTSIMKCCHGDKFGSMFRSKMFSAGILISLGLYHYT